MAQLTAHTAVLGASHLAGDCCTTRFYDDNYHDSNNACPPATTSFAATGRDVKDRSYALPPVSVGAPCESVVRSATAIHAAHLLAAVTYRDLRGLLDSSQQSQLD